MSTSLSTVSHSTAEGGWNEIDADDLAAISEKLRRAAELLEQLAENAASGGKPSASSLSAAMTLVLNVRGRLYGSDRPDLEGSARQRILTHLLRNEGEPVSA